MHPRSKMAFKQYTTELEKFEELVPFWICEERVKNHFEKTIDSIVEDSKKHNKILAEMENSLPVDFNLQEIEEEIIILTKNLIKNWIRLLWITFDGRLRQDKTIESILLNLKFLPLTEPLCICEILPLAEPISCRCKKWQDFLGRTYRKSCVEAVDDIEDIFEGFIKNLTKEIEEEGELVIPGNLIIKKGIHLYYLKEKEEEEDGRRSRRI